MSIPLYPLLWGVSSFQGRGSFFFEGFFLPHTKLTMSLRAFRGCSYVHPLSRYLNIAGMNRKMVLLKDPSIVRTRFLCWILLGSVLGYKSVVSFWSNIIFPHLSGPFIFLHIFLVESIGHAWHPSPLSITLKWASSWLWLSQVGEPTFPPTL